MKRLEKLITESTASEKKRAEDVIAFLKSLSGHHAIQHIVYHEHGHIKQILTDAAEIVQYFIDKTF